ncbi:MAG: major capsid protein [bacterium]
MPQGAVIDLISVGPHDAIITPIVDEKEVAKIRETIKSQNSGLSTAEVEEEVNRLTTPDVSIFEGETYTYERFQMEEVSLQGNGTLDFDSEVQYTINKVGDLISDMKLDVNIPALSLSSESSGEQVAWVNMLGTYLIKEKKLEIGGLEVQKIRSRFADIWDRLTVKEGQKVGYYEMIGQAVYKTFIGPRGNVATTFGTDALQVKKGSQESRKLLIPLKFFFCENYEQALPIVALGFNKIYVTIKTRSYNELIHYVNGATLSDTPKLHGKLWITYVYITENARARMTSDKLSFPIVQVFDNGENGVTVSSGNPRFSLNFTRPVCELFWVVQEKAAIDGKCYDHFDKYTGNTTLYENIPSVTSSQLYINGVPRQDSRGWEYHTRDIYRKRHENIPQSRSINAYIWAVNPESSYPMGTSNFTRHQSVELELTCPYISGSTTGQFFAFARSINFFDIEDGWGSLLFAG